MFDPGKIVHTQPAAFYYCFYSGPDEQSRHSSGGNGTGVLSNDPCMIFSVISTSLPLNEDRPILEENTLSYVRSSGLMFFCSIPSSNYLRAQIDHNLRVFKTGGSQSCPTMTGT